jgi:hypothetical protein
MYNKNNNGPKVDPSVPTPGINNERSLTLIFSFTRFWRRSWHTYNSKSFDKFNIKQQRISNFCKFTFRNIPMKTFWKVVNLSRAFCDPRPRSYHIKSAASSITSPEVRRFYSKFQRNFTTLESGNISRYMGHQSNTVFTFKEQIWLVYTSLFCLKIHSHVHAN